MAAPDLSFVLSPADYSPQRTLSARIRRRLTQWQTADALPAVDRTCVTIGFDDFPKSAADTGADLLGEIGAKGLFYACTGLAGGDNLTGPQYDAADLQALVKAGHMIGAHTHTHLDCATRPVDDVLADIDHNLDQLRQMGHEEPITQFAYPYGETTPALKRALIGRFAACRGILPGTNAAGADRMQLRAFELTPDPTSTDRAVAAIEAATRHPRWLHIFTHDVRQIPSPFGTTPGALRRVLRAARDAGIAISPAGPDAHVRAMS